MVFSLFEEAQKEVVISQPDINAALIHINSLPHTITAKMPANWGQQQFLHWLKESMPKNPKIGDMFSVATGIYGHVVPLGNEFLNHPNDDRYQVVLSIRKCTTNLKQLIKISE